MSIQAEFHQAHLARLERISNAAKTVAVQSVQYDEPIVEVIPASEPLPMKPIWFEIVEEIELTPRPVTMADIRRATCDYFGVGLADILSGRRDAQAVYRRHVAMYLSKTLTRRSLPEIGRRLGGKDHTTILHGVRKIQTAIKSDWMIAYDVAHIEAML